MELYTQYYALLVYCIQHINIRYLYFMCILYTAKKNTNRVQNIIFSYVKNKNINSENTPSRRIMSKYYIRYCPTFKNVNPEFFFTLHVHFFAYADRAFYDGMFWYLSAVM